MYKILVIEDEKILREEIIEILKFEGYVVFNAENGKDGLQSALNNQPDLILCDIMMPLMKGTDVLKNLMQSESGRHIPFIFITALNERHDIRSGMESGADDYLVKPFSISELLGSVKSRIDKFNNQTAHLQSIVLKTKKQLSKQITVLKEKIIVQNNDAELARLDKQIQSNNQGPRDGLAESLQAIEAANKLNNIDKIVKKKMISTQTGQNVDQFFVKLYNEIHKQSQIATNWGNFQLKFIQIYPHFNQNLLSRFPHLKQHDITLASAIGMNLSTPQIASLLNINLDSVRKGKYRLKKAMGLQKQERLSDIVHSFFDK